MPSCIPGLHEVTTRFGCCHVLVDEEGAAIVDTGLFGARRRFEALFRRLDLQPRSVQAIILTHGHVDHAGNVAWLREWTGARVFAHPAEQAHIDGAFPYRGWARICGGLEAIARRLSRYRAVPIDEPLHDEQNLPWWGGLRVIHLPGHTAGHCGLWSERHRLLFCGDLVAIWRHWSEFPPFYFNTEGPRLRASLERAAALRPVLVVPNHYSITAPFDPAGFALRFHTFAAAKLRRAVRSHPAR